MSKIKFFLGLFLTTNLCFGELVCRFEVYDGIVNSPKLYYTQKNVETAEDCAKFCNGQSFCNGAAYDSDIKLCKLHFRKDDCGTRPRVQATSLQKFMIGCIQCEDRPATPQPPRFLDTDPSTTTPATGSSKSRQIFVHFMENPLDAERTNDFTLDPQFLCGDPTLYYPCADRRGCVMVIDLLNGVKDCPDGSDEDDHYVNKCAAGIHRCTKNQQCVTLASGSYDCINSGP